jgi:hypothetical protein
VPHRSQLLISINPPALTGPRGCLPPDLLIDTLSTYNLLFPSTDEASQVMLRDAVKQDHAFAEGFSVFSRGHEGPRDARNPENMADLYQRFPHWAERLDVLWREIENPTPVTRIERWSERRKSARWATWWVVLGLLCALLFGLMATVLGALQVWISYCSWLDDPMVPGCPTKQRFGPSAQGVSGKLAQSYDQGTD